MITKIPPPKMNPTPIPMYFREISFILNASISYPFKKQKMSAAIKLAERKIVSKMFL